MRVLYATDTGGIPVRAARIVGIDAHIADGKPITGLIMEATMGIDHDEDFRIFTHSSVGTVLRTAHVLLDTGRLKDPQGQPVSSASPCRLRWIGSHIQRMIFRHRIIFTACRHP